MIALSQSVTITSYNNGVDLYAPYVFSEVSWTYKDYPKRKLVAVNFSVPPRVAIIFQGDNYPAEVNDAVVEQRISELIGNDPQAYFQSLM